MLEKLAGNDNVEKLRIIVLFEADFNNNNKWIGRVTMHLAEKHNLLVPKQYGSWKHKAVIMQCLNKCLFYDHHCHTRQPAALCSNNAKSCYNWIVLIIAALSLCCLGAPQLAVRSMITMLAHLNHHVCTAFGNSENSQGSNRWQKAVADIGHGNGTGPHIWAAVSTPLFNIMQTDGFVAKFICALSQQQKELAGFAFVNNTDLTVNDDRNTTDAVIDKMQKSLSMWHGLLRATGGELVPEKCFWYLIDFKWENNKWAYKKTGEAPGQIRVMINPEE